MAAVAGTRTERETETPIQKNESGCCLANRWVQISLLVVGLLGLGMGYFYLQGWEWPRITTMATGAFFVALFVIGCCCPRPRLQAAEGPKTASAPPTDNIVNRENAEKSIDRKSVDQSHFISEDQLRKDVFGNFLVAHVGANTPGVTDVSYNETQCYEICVQKKGTTDTYGVIFYPAILYPTLSDKVTWRISKEDEAYLRSFGDINEKFFIDLLEGVGAPTELEIVQNPNLPKLSNPIVVLAKVEKPKAVQQPLKQLSLKQLSFSTMPRVPRTITPVDSEEEIQQNPLGKLLVGNSKVQEIQATNQWFKRAYACSFVGATANDTTTLVMIPVNINGKLRWAIPKVSFGDLQKISVNEYDESVLTNDIGYCLPTPPNMRDILYVDYVILGR